MRVPRRLPRERTVPDTSLDPAVVSLIDALARAIAREDDALERGASAGTDGGGTRDESA